MIGDWLGSLDRIEIGKNSCNEIVISDGKLFGTTLRYLDGLSFGTYDGTVLRSLEGSTEGMAEGNL